MTFDVTGADTVAAAGRAPWGDPNRYWAGIDAATRDRPAPVVALSVPALRRNADDLRRRAGGIPIRVASKSVRSRAVLEAVLALPGFRGVLAYTVAEALWLAETIDDVVVAYPSADRSGLRRLGESAELAARVTVMVDSEEQLDLIDAAVAPGSRAHIRVCLDFDASWRSRALGHVGVRRSPIHTPEQLRDLARRVVARPGFRLVGVMAYEAQIAGVGDRAANPAEAALLRTMQRVSGAELAERRGAAVAAVRDVAELEFVNGGGTGSIERTAAEAAITEVAAGSGLYGPHLFDGYRAFTVAPALAFALDVVRKPTPDRATLLGGGWIASGPAAPDRLPRPVWPAGLSYEAREGAGEVQTPVRGATARALHVGDRVWLRHTKAGEPLEHTTELVPVGADGTAGDPVLSYRGEGKCFL
ncbi:alanine racemase [Leucobacter chromiireducens]|uniref:Amino acid deaminase/aldolase n=1 Tax=Leucobacter chromiireducens subsp. solipictus TaxID=398235 RepID=A0ABS1SCM3_9MICO|nr:alanine racemase [Leucobacter chromiireducens]MBL3678289.1 amino acid deaminase/aldolase [Leucobacter chromiireducens subsp. solipictus]